MPSLHVNPIQVQNENGFITFAPEVFLQYADDEPEFDYIQSLIGWWDYYISPQVTIDAPVNVDVRVTDAEGNQTGSGHQSQNSVTAYIYGWPKGHPNWMGAVAFVFIPAPTLRVSASSRLCTINLTVSGALNFAGSVNASIYVTEPPQPPPSPPPQQPNAVVRQSTGESGSDFQFYPILRVTPDINGSCEVDWNWKNYFDGNLVFSSSPTIINTFQNLVGSQTIDLQLVDNRDPATSGRDPSRNGAIAIGIIDFIGFNKADGTWHSFRSDVTVTVKSPSGASVSVSGTLGPENFKSS